jgi:hypothetical protein
MPGFDSENRSLAVALVIDETGALYPANPKACAIRVSVSPRMIPTAAAAPKVLKAWL